MTGPDLDNTDVATLRRLQAENAELHHRLESAEQTTAQTLARATRLSQVISVLAHDGDFDALAERAAVEVAELFSTDIALLMLGPDDACAVEGNWGVRASDLPPGRFAVGGLERLTADAPVIVGAAGDLEQLPDWLARYAPEHLAWARLLVGDQSLGLMLLVRRGHEPFERSDETELRAIAYRIALAMENGLLHRRMRDQLARLRRMQELTTQLAGTLELETVGTRVAEMLVSEVHVAASVVLIDREGELERLAQVGSAAGSDAEVCGCDGWECFELATPGRRVGCIAVTEPPPDGSEEHELLLHLVGLAALALDKALLYERSREQARHDSLTGLLGHRVFHELLEEQLELNEPFSIVLIDIDDFKQINDLYGHQTGDDTLRRVADELCKGVRDHDRVFRIGGEEFCVVLPGLEHSDAFRVAERMRACVASIVFTLPVTVSLGVASCPQHARRRDDLLAHADAALYASKRSGKNRTSVAGAPEVPVLA